MQARIKNNLCENKNRINHQYQVKDQVLIVYHFHYWKNQRKLSSPTEGPYTITKVYKNSTVELDQKDYYERMNI